MFLVAGKHGQRRKMSVNRDMNKEEKLKALDAALTQIEKAYGKGSVMKLGESGVNMNIETVPTGSISLDIALGLGGVPKEELLKCTVLSLPVRLPLPFIW